MPLTLSSGWNSPRVFVPCYNLARYILEKWYVQSLSLTHSPSKTLTQQWSHIAYFLKTIYQFCRCIKFWFQYHACLLLLALSFLKTIYRFYRCLKFGFQYHASLLLLALSSSNILWSKARGRDSWFLVVNENGFRIFDSWVNKKELEWEKKRMVTYHCKRDTVGLPCRCVFLICWLVL